jgi:predicted RNase H-like HicB family nuclease
MFTMRYRVMVEQDEDGFFVAEYPSLPGPAGGNV